MIYSSVRISFEQQVSVRITKMLMGTGIRERVPGTDLKVNCLVVTVKIMFKWYNNVVATKVAD